jgi:hypothetical protein
MLSFPFIQLSSLTQSQSFYIATVMGFIPSFGIRDSVTKWLNPDATKADLGEGMQAYYDEDKKVWVFPGEDPAEIAKPIGPPPTTPLGAAMSPNYNMPSSEPREKNDPLAAMMAPPPRVPSSQKFKSPGAKPGAMMMYPPGMMPPTAGATNATAPPQFAVFAPIPDPSKKQTSEG